MARKANNTNATPTPKRSRRAPEEVVADLRARIDSVQRRAAAQAAKAAPEVKPLMIAVRALDRAIEAAQANEPLHQALEAARGTLGQELGRLGLPAPRRRVKAEAAA